MSGQDILKKAEKQLNKLNFEKATPLFQKAASKYGDARSYRGLAECHRVLGNNRKAELAYAKLMKLPDPRPEDFVRYGQVLKKLRKYDKAADVYKNYRIIATNKEFANLLIESCEEIPRFMVDSSRYKLHRLNINTEYGEISPVFYRKGLSFTSNRPRGFFFKFLNGSGKSYFYDIYYAESLGRTTFRDPEIIPGKINTKFHDGPASFSPAGHRAYLTRSYTRGGFVKRDDKGRNKLKIYETQQVYDRWRAAKKLDLDKEGYSAAHPCVSRDGKQLFFASDMPGGYGGLDLWVSHWEDSLWSAPENMGATINTPGNEGFPNVDTLGNLYFASDARPGLGGWDLFRSGFANGSWTAPVNMGYPLNSEVDDFGLIYEPESGYGYFSSNRDGNYDLFCFETVPVLWVEVSDSISGKPLDSVKVEVLDIHAGKKVLYTNGEGRLKLEYKAGKEYFFTFNAADYKQRKERVKAPPALAGEDPRLNFTLARKYTYRLFATVTDKHTGAPISNARIRMMGSQEERIKANEQGGLLKILVPEQDYRIIADKSGFAPLVTSLSTGRLEYARDYYLDIELAKDTYLFLEGNVLDKETFKPVRGATLRVLTDSNKVAGMAVTRQDGMFWVSVRPNDHYDLITSANGYFSQRITSEPTSSGPDSTIIRVDLIPMQLDKVIKTIHYAYNDSSVSVFSQKELNEVVYFLQDNPDVSLKLIAHTDTRGSESYNQQLSTARANAAVAYIINCGVDPGRIIAEGKGESQLLNHCKDGVECSDELHQQNRRAELTVVKIQKSE